MKNIFYAFIIISLLFSCKSNTKQADKDSITKSQATSDQSQNLIKKFGPIIQGVWLKKDYIEKVSQSKSVAAAEDRKNGITEMCINTDSIHGDSIVLVAGYFNHDSGNVVIKFKSGKNPSAIKFNNGELSYLIEHGDTTITISEYDDQKKRLINTTFTRVLKKGPENNLEYGMSYAINKSIISGSYMMTDSIGTISRVIFTNDGKVRGFLNHSKYQINFDLNSDPMDNLDEISFDIRSKSYSSFSYKFIDDTLSLYDTHPNADSTELILGKRIYKLVKQK